MTVIDYLRKNIILTAAWILAIVSMFFVHPSAAYLEYIDFRSLLILWSLMIIMRGYMDAGIFDFLALRMLTVTKTYKHIAVALVVLCFFSSMLITNDVALITFVPFSLYVLPRYNVRRYIIPILTLETIAANLGSMLTPIGNPQNLYLFNLSKMTARDFMGVMLPFSAVSLILLVACALFMVKGKESVVRNTASGISIRDRINTYVYSALFFFAIMTVLKLVPVMLLAPAVLLVFLIVNRRAIVQIDYGLLMTFVGFFIFTGNMARIPGINDMLTNLVEGNELIMGICFSQVISNVPAALLLSDFTGNYVELIRAVNIGGLGTLIASMASLITFKLFADDYDYAKGVFVSRFTIMNLIYLAVLISLALVLGKWCI